MKFALFCWNKPQPPKTDTNPDDEMKHVGFFSKSDNGSVNSMRLTLCLAKEEPVTHTSSSIPT